MDAFKIAGGIIISYIGFQMLGLQILVIFVSLIFWGLILGTVGMILAVPLTMALKIFLEQKKSTKWVAVMLGTDEDANKMLDYKKKNK
jgi:predicted PurR-regulated permease PerM